MKYKTMHDFSIYDDGCGTMHFSVKTINKVHYEAWLQGLKGIVEAFDKAAGAVLGITQYTEIPLLEKWQGNPATGIFYQYHFDYADKPEEEVLLYTIELRRLKELIRTLEKSTA